MKKILGVLCILIAVASGGWKVGKMYLSDNTSNLIHVGDVSVREGTTVQFVGQDQNLIGPGMISVVKPAILQIEGILWLLSATFAFVSGITLLRKTP